MTYAVAGVISWALVMGTQVAPADYSSWIDLLEREGAARVAEEMSLRVPEAQLALGQLLDAFDASIHSSRRRPEQRRVRYSREYLSGGLRLAEIFSQVTGETGWQRRFEAREARIRATEALNSKQFDRALELVDLAKAKALESGDRQFLFSLDLTSAYAYLEQRRPHLALEHCEGALALALESQDEIRIALAYYNLGAAYLHLGRPEDSIPYSRQAAGASHEIGFRLWEANARLNLGSAELLAGRFEDAERDFRKALELSRYVGDALAEGRSLFNLGLLYVRRREWDDARRNLEQSLEFIRRVDIRHSHEIDEYNHVERTALQVLLACYRQLGIDDASLIDPIRERLTMLAAVRSEADHHDHH